MSQRACWAARAALKPMMQLPAHDGGDFVAGAQPIGTDIPIPPRVSAP